MSTSGGKGLLYRRTLKASLRHSWGSPVAGMPADMSCRENICTEDAFSQSVSQSVSRNRLVEACMHAICHLGTALKSTTV